MSPGNEPLSGQAASSAIRRPTLHDRKALYQLSGVLGIMLLALALGLYDGQRYGALYIVGSTIVVVYALFGPLARHRPWGELGLKRGFRRDFKRVWYYFGIDALLFQVVPPTLAVAYVLGYYPDLISHIAGRLSFSFGSLEGATAIGGLLATALVLTLMEEVVFRVTIQERLSWFVGTPAAIIIASAVFGLAHAVGTTGSLTVVLTDVAGVVIDGVFFGIIYAKTHNLALTCATHYAADVIGVLMLALVF